MAYKIIFILSNISVLFLMKVIGCLTFAGCPTKRKKHLYNAPTFTPKTKSFPHKKVSNASVIFNLLYGTLLIILYHSMAKILIGEYELNDYLRGVISLPFVFVITFFLGHLFRAICTLTRDVPIDIHNHPWKSKSISEFWTLRWNVWIRDWLHQVGKYIAPHSAKTRRLLIFFISGCFHELMVNLPYFIYTGKTIFGSMIVYFLIQYMAVSLDQYLKRFNLPKIRFVLLYLSLFIPAPLFTNEAFRLFFGL